VKTLGRLVITFAVLGLFVLVIAASIAIVIGGAGVPGVGGGRVAVVPVYGSITLGGCSQGILFSESCAQVQSIREQIREYDNDPMVSAIVFDVYSGGGNVVASRELMRAIRDADKPTVAWIGEVGASGAYYAATGADRIVADEASITGSIGVIMPIMHYYELFDDIGINMTVLKAGDSKDIGSPYRPMDEGERQEMQYLIDQVYFRFLSDVAENRGLSVDYVSNVSQGRIYLGADAYEVGLVDDLGGFDKAVSVASQLAGIVGEPEIVRPKRTLSWFDLLR
jgi:protease IV